ncbi:hypothetical protein [Roseibium algae]|uniref:Uncharacterized protein n=1 Tax=Roseibium algae TaxID=3123038 RepID=A0ABU8TG88_9HYPH
MTNIANSGISLVNNNKNIEKSILIDRYSDVVWPVKSGQGVFQKWARQSAMRSNKHIMRLKMALGKLKTGFGAAALATMMTVTPAAYAQDAQPVSQTQEQLICEDVGEYQCATPGYGVFPEDSELALGIMSEGQVIIHFGRGIANAGTTAASMSDGGVPTVAVPGYEQDGEAIFYVDGARMQWPPTTQEVMDRAPFWSPLKAYFENKRAQQAALINHDDEDRPTLAALTADAN